MTTVTAAIIEQDGLILIARRKPGKALAGYWEFPGGKLEPGEHPAECLKREIREEMNLHVDVLEPVGTNEHEYPSGRIRLLAFRARLTGGDLQLTDHDQIRWVLPHEINTATLAPADIPILQAWKTRPH